MIKINFLTASAMTLVTLKECGYRLNVPKEAVIFLFLSVFSACFFMILGDIISFIEDIRPKKKKKKKFDKKDEDDLS